MRKTAAEVLKMVDGEPILALQGTIKNVYPWKSGVSEKGTWSFQDLVLQDETGEVRLKAKNLEDLSDLKGKEVTIEANKSDKHGWTGVKKAVETFEGKTYHKALLTASCKIKPVNGESPQLRTTAEPKIAPDNVVEYDEFAGVRNARAFAMKAANALLISIEATRHVASEFERKHLGEELSGDQQQAMTSSIFISMNREGLVGGLPATPLKPLVRESVLPEKVKSPPTEEIPW